MTSINQTDGIGEGKLLHGSTGFQTSFAFSKGAIQLYLTCFTQFQHCTLVVVVVLTLTAFAAERKDIHVEENRPVFRRFSKGLTHKGVGI